MSLSYKPKNVLSIQKLLSIIAVSGMLAFSSTTFAQTSGSATAKKTNMQAAEPEKAKLDEKTGMEENPAKQSPAAASSGELNPLMSVAYIGQFCEAWNADELMTKGLADSEWVDNDGDKGFKIIQLYRNDCPDSPHVEMQFERQDDKAICVYAGKVENPELDRSADYEMFADTKRWIEIGNGDYGPMKAMMFGRLKFKGPKIEAMGNMGPFKNFLLLFGHFPSDPTVCP
jgi:putative sterol carrier protein